MYDILTNKIFTKKGRRKINLKIALITTEFYPVIGGVSLALNSICKAFRNNTQNTLYVFNRYYKGRNIFDLLDKKKEYKIKDLLIFKKTHNLICLFKSIWTILNEKKTKKLLPN